MPIALCKWVLIVTNFLLPVVVVFGVGTLIVERDALLLPVVVTFGVGTLIVGRDVLLSPVVVVFGVGTLIVERDVRRVLCLNCRVERSLRTLPPSAGRALREVCRWCPHAGSLDKS